MIWAPQSLRGANWSAEAHTTWSDLLARANGALVLAHFSDGAPFRARNQYTGADVAIAVRGPARSTGGTATTIERAARQSSPSSWVHVLRPADLATSPRSTDAQCLTS
ncbi:MAG: hypothetical protein ACOH2F_09855 [Cellulomonas sp.]